MHHALWEERVSIFIGLNAIFQFVGDVVLEALGYIPPRINHLALTFLNAFISWKTLSAISKDKLRFLHEDCQTFWVLEVLLILGDVYYAFYDDWDPVFIFFRLTFIVLSSFNWCFITYIIIKYDLYHLTYQGSPDEDEESFIHKDDENNSDKEDDHKDLSHAAIEIQELKKKISVADENEDGDGDGNGDGSPALGVIDENMKDYHGQDTDQPPSVEDSLSDKIKEIGSKITSRGHSAMSAGYHHTPVPHDDPDHEHLDHSHVSHHGQISTNNISKLHPKRPSITITQSEVP